jgi:hypothetical protein
MMIAASNANIKCGTHYGAPATAALGVNPSNEPSDTPKVVEVESNFSIEALDKSVISINEKSMSKSCDLNPLYFKLNSSILIIINVALT